MDCAKKKIYFGVNQKAQSIENTLLKDHLITIN